MKEILTICNVKEDFERLGVALRQTYSGEYYGVCEVTEEEFRKLCLEPDIAGTWVLGGWRYCEGSIQPEPTKKILIMNKEILAWHEELDDEEELDNEPPSYANLLEYLCDHMGASLSKNVCALTMDLAKYNNMKLSELFIKYQG